MMTSGPLDKMQARPADSPGDMPSVDFVSVNYLLPLGDARVPLNALVGETLRLSYTGRIFCTHCGRKTNKSFSQGYCYPCFKTLAQCDTCIVSPEKCHFAAGTCREPDWAQQHCMTDHIVYLANSSGLKIGITRASQMPTRWLDQGAVQALPVARVADRHLSGLVEVLAKAHVADKTDWRALLRGDAPALDLCAARDQLRAVMAADVADLQQRYGLTAVQWLAEAPVRQFRYPVSAYPAKIATFNFDKQPEVAGRLLGIKGQYLLFADGALNIRKFTGYEVALDC